MKDFLKEICYSLANFDDSSSLAKCIIAMLAIVGNLTLLFTTMFYLTDGVIFWRGVHVIALSLLLAMAILFLMHTLEKM
ncbi:hypothetical protein CCON61_08570 [Campylobacter concisus]|uniref:hypothetical protein n=1 Tax=Campylobacter concisus TaxID=199 RepID=UPI000A1FD7EC|nr:hypothetical protein [Campylobacter concisus]OSQ23605.1 hypothetical protein CCON61_08570 [Campylobacter concisus]